MPRFRPKNFVLLEVGQSLKPGETTTDHTSYVVQGEGYYEYVDSVGHIEERVPGTFTRPWRAPDTWVFTKDLAEAWAYIEKANRERPVSHDRPYRDTYSVRDGFTFNNQSGEYIETSFKQRRPL